MPISYTIFIENFVILIHVGIYYFNSLSTPVQYVSLDDLLTIVVLLHWQLRHQCLLPFWWCCYALCHDSATWGICHTSIDVRTHLLALRQKQPSEGCRRKDGDVTSRWWLKKGRQGGAEINIWGICRLWGRTTDRLFGGTIKGFQSICISLHFYFYF